MKFVIRRTAVLAAAIAACTLAATAQNADDQPLFADTSPFELTLEAPIRTLVNRRARRPEVTGTLSYRTTTGDAAGQTVVLDVEVSTRGNSRLEVCSFPPLRLNLRRDQVEGTLFASQNRLKLVTRCSDNPRAEEYLALEYLAYRIFETVSDHAYRVRHVRMRYVDTERDGRVEEAPAFLIESIEGLAARTGLVPLDVPSIRYDTLDSAQSAAIGIFQYLIGNTDWSAIAASGDADCCHNGDVLAPGEGTGPYYVVPYDFDQAGLVFASYSEPNPDLGLRNVRQRLYRGFCNVNDELVEPIAKLNAARPAIEAELAAAGLSDDRLEDTRAFLAEGFDILNDPERRQAQIVDRCRSASR